MSRRCSGVFISSVLWSYPEQPYMKTQPDHSITPSKIKKILVLNKSPLKVYARKQPTHFSIIPLTKKPDFFRFQNRLKITKLVPPLKMPSQS